MKIFQSKFPLGINQSIQLFFILALGFIVTSCSDSFKVEKNMEPDINVQGSTVQHEMCGNESEFIDVVQTSEDVKSIMYQVVDHINTDGIDTEAEFDDYMFTDVNDPIVGNIKTWLHFITDHGTLALVDEFELTGKISPAYAIEIRTLINELDVMFNGDVVDETIVINYFTSKEQSVVNNVNLCEYEKFQFKITLANCLGQFKYLYENEVLNLNRDQVGNRDCSNIFQMIGCAMLSVIGNDVVFLVENASTIAKLIACLKKEDNGCAWPELIKLITSRVKKIGRINKIYEWCCKSKEKCGPPISYTIEDIDCNTYRIRLHGPGVYGMTLWQAPFAPIGNNIVYLQNPTPTPSVLVTIPNGALPSIVNGIVTCVDNSGTTDIPFRFAARQISNISHNLLNPYWVTPPPTQIQSGSTHDIIIGNAPGVGDDYTMTISHGSGIFVMSQGNGYSGYYRLFGSMPGNYTITVTFTHNCTGATTVMTRNIQVN